MSTIFKYRTSNGKECWDECQSVGDLLTFIDWYSNEVDEVIFIIEIKGRSNEQSEVILDVKRHIENARKQIKYHKITSEIEFMESKVRILQDELAELEEAQS